MFEAILSMSGEVTGQATGHCTPQAACIPRNAFTKTTVQAVQPPFLQPG